ncbi:MAG: hypothetical protein HeimC3_53080 [Candidatus Heimdallarchaeota archaeon LC_3]|nr:MAG: hypothetical protein HeimC3_53080 [Candidatus Heimdallarchaeota archaeon LC_3]
MNKVNLHVLTESVQKNIINDVINGYFECREFFNKYTNQDYEIHTKKKKTFLFNICIAFYNKHKSFSGFFEEELMLKLIKKHYYVPMKFKSGGFEFPRSFTSFIDRIKDINQIPAINPDLGDIDSYMRNIPPECSINDFLHGLFKQLKRLNIILRKREVEVLHLLSNLDFLQKKKDGSPRITVPTDSEILTGLQLSEKQAKRVERAIGLLFNLKICSIAGIIMNPAKFGYYFALIDDKYNNEIEKSNFLFWKIPFSNSCSYIVCLPFEKTPEFLSNYNYIPLTHWLWNVSMTDYESNKENVWANFTLPNFLMDDLAPAKHRKWNLTEKDKKIFSPKEWEIIIELSRMNNLSVDNLNELSSKRDHKSVIHLSEYLVKNEIFQYYPNVNYIGIDYRICFRMHSEDKNLFKKIVNGFLAFPIVQIFINDEINELLGYIHLPRHTVSLFLDSIDDLKDRHKSMDIRLSFNSNYILSRCFNLKN